MCTCLSPKSSGLFPGKWFWDALIWRHRKIRIRDFLVTQFKPCLAEPWYHIITFKNLWCFVLNGAALCSSFSSWEAVTKPDCPENWKPCNFHHTCIHLYLFYPDLYWLFRQITRLSVFTQLAPSQSSFFQGWTHCAVTFSLAPEELPIPLTNLDVSAIGCSSLACIFRLSWKVQKRM